MKAFHPQLPVIATCGVSFSTRFLLRHFLRPWQLDRTVKIWFVPPASKVLLTREDKPLFSSSKIHKARVSSISWYVRSSPVPLFRNHMIVGYRLHHDLLLTHSAPALMREHLNNPESKATFLEPGQLIIWRWLAIDRFFPPGSDNEMRQNVLRGCASVSSSIKSII